MFRVSSSTAWRPDSDQRRAMKHPNLGKESKFRETHPKQQPAFKPEFRRPHFNVWNGNFRCFLLNFYTLSQLD